MYKLIAAADAKFGIGKDNTLPWDFKEDMQFFHSKTSTTTDSPKNILIMGRKTYESIPPAHRPLKNRHNIVISRQKTQAHFPQADNLYFVNSINAAIDLAESIPNKGEIFCIGGANIYNQFLERDLIDQILLTRIDADFKCDTFLHDFRDQFSLDSQKDAICTNRQDQTPYSLRFQSYKAKI